MADDAKVEHAVATNKVQQAVVNKGIEGIVEKGLKIIGERPTASVDAQVAVDYLVGVQTAPTPTPAPPVGQAVPPAPASQG